MTTDDTESDPELFRWLVRTKRKRIRFSLSCPAGQVMWELIVGSPGDATDDEIVASLTACNGQIVPVVVGDADKSDSVDVDLDRNDDGQLRSCFIAAALSRWALAC